MNQFLATWNLPDISRWYLWENFEAQQSGRLSPGQFIISHGYMMPIEADSLPPLTDENSPIPTEGPANEQALRGLARQIRWKRFPSMQDSELKSAEHQRAEDHEKTVKEVRQETLMSGLLLASDEVDEKRTIRLGDKWLKDVDGNKAEMPPAELYPDELLHWLKNRAIRVAEADLLDEPETEERQPRDKAASVDTAVVSDEGEGDPLRLLGDEETQQDISEVIRNLALSPQQQEIVEMDIILQQEGVPEPR